MAVGLTAGVGENGTDCVFRRSFSVLVLAECLERDNVQHLLPSAKVFDWGDRIASWYLREKDTRGYVPGKGWAHAIAHGADAIGVLGQSPHLAANELDRAASTCWPTACSLTDDGPLLAGEPDRMAHAAMQILRRNVVSLEVLEPWIHRIGGAANPFGKGGSTTPTRSPATPQAFLRALFVQLSLAPEAPTVRPDLILVLVEALRMSNSAYLRVGTG